jgi:hypothetical protein
MTVFERLDGPTLAQRIRTAQRRVLLASPGFADDVGAALIAMHRRHPTVLVSVVVDGTDQAARMGYGHFDAIVELSRAGVDVRLEPGLRLGAVVIDDAGWCFATPPLFVDPTMERATAPNAMRMGPEQLNELIQALHPSSSNDAAAKMLPEIGGLSASAEQIGRTQEALAADPPQPFDIARKVQVFNAFVEFVELELLGTQITRQRVQLPTELLLAVSDEATRERLTTSFRLVDPEAAIGKGAVALRKKVDGLRKAQNLHALKDFGTVSLRSNRSRLESAVAALQAEVAAFAEEVRQRLGKEIEHSRRQLVQSIVPALKAKPPDALQSGVIGKPTVDHIKRWVEVQLDRTFPDIASLVREMRLVLSIKGATYETLNDANFRTAVRAAYPLVDFDKPFREFSAAPAKSQPELPGMR